MKYKYCYINYIYVHESTFSTDQLQVYHSLLGYDNVSQREGEVDASDVREIEIITATGVLHYHQCLELIDVGHKVALCVCVCERERERERFSRQV